MNSIPRSADLEHAHGSRRRAGAGAKTAPDHHIDKPCLSVSYLKKGQHF